MIEHDCAVGRRPYVRRTVMATAASRIVETEARFERKIERMFERIFERRFETYC